MLRRGMRGDEKMDRSGQLYMHYRGRVLRLVLELDTNMSCDALGYAERSIVVVLLDMPCIQARA